METRRIQYSIDFIHILTFKEEYKSAVLPYFGFDNLKYSIDNENSINESIRLMFNTEKIAVFFGKSGITMVFDGQSKDLKNINGAMRIFWGIYERVQKFNGYQKTVRQTIVCHSVKLLEKENYDNILIEVPFLKNNPFGKLNDFACIYEYERENKFYKFDFGNFTEKDVKKHDLNSFNAPMNNDLLKGVGLMCRTEIREELPIVSFSKFRALLNEAEELVDSYKLE